MRNNDKLQLYVDSMLETEFSGSQLSFATYTANIATAGTHVFEFRWVKDASGEAGLDAAFIDSVRTTNAVPTP